MIGRGKGWKSKGQFDKVGSDIASQTERVSYYIHYQVYDEITYTFPNSIDTAIEVWEWIINFIPHFTGHMITYPCWD